MTNNTLHFNWLLRYKLYHLPLWFIYHYLWWTITIGNVWVVASNIFFSAYSIKFGFYVLFQAIAVYFNLYFLIPRYLGRGRYFPYISLLVATILCTAALIATGYYVSVWFSGKSFSEMYSIYPDNYFYLFKNNTLPSTIASITLAMSFKLTKNWIQSKHREQALEKEKLETELKFLRSQFNPHFLFNTINSIFVLINKNPRLASESLAKFSEILRYQLYECNEQQIPFSQELSYLENFIELQKLRQDHGNVKTVVKVNVPHAGNLVIAPFVLMPFIENAFKHVSKHKDQPNWISIKLWLYKNELYLEISNSTARNMRHNNEFIRHGGIGLTNVKRRLALLYPECHNLIIDQSDDVFRVILNLKLLERTSVRLPQLLEVDK